ncbi:hypothetical protein FEM54_31115, partial [Pseudomonas edaphica]
VMDQVGAGFCGSWLACDAGDSVFLKYRGDAIAGKPAPTQASSPVSFLVFVRSQTGPQTDSPA